MPATMSSSLGNEAKRRSSSDPRSDPASPASGQPVRDSLARSFVRGLESIFGSFFDRPDYGRYYEQDLRRRLEAPWVRVGQAMQLALGKPVTLTLTLPDGRRTARVVAPDGSNEEYRAALRRAREAIPDPEADTVSDHVIHLTGKQAEDFMTFIDEATQNDPR